MAIGLIGSLISKVVNTVTNLFTGGNEKTYEIIDSQIWQKPTKFKSATIMLIGGGGGGGGGPLDVLYGGQGGAAGKTNINYIRLNDLPSSINVEIGACGLGGFQLDKGTNGGITKFGTLFNANGGNGGGIGNNGAPWGNTNPHSGSPGENSYGDGGQGGSSGVNGQDGSFGGGGGGAGTGAMGGKGGSGYCRITCWK
jgi:hypothetical protein